MQGRGLGPRDLRLVAAALFIIAFEMMVLFGGLPNRVSAFVGLGGLPRFRPARRSIRGSPTIASAWPSTAPGARRLLPTSLRAAGAEEVQYSIRARYA